MRLATETGWTFDEIDQLTLFDVTDFFDYWMINPPLRDMVAAYLGVGKEEPKRATKEDLRSLAKQFGG